MFGIFYGVFTKFVNKKNQHCEVHSNDLQFTYRYVYVYLYVDVELNEIFT